MQTTRARLLTGAAVGFALTAPLAALMYLGARLADLPMTPFILMEQLTRIQQLGGLVTKAIDVMVGLFSNLPGISTGAAAKTFEQVMAVLLFMTLGAIAGVLYEQFRPGSTRSLALVIGAVGWTLSIYLRVSAGIGLVTFLIEGIWLAVLWLAWGYALGWVCDVLRGMAENPDQARFSPARRAFIRQFGGGAIALTVGGWLFGGLINRPSTSGAGKPIATGATGPTPSAAPPQAATGSFTVVPGTRLEITPNDQFYRVDINVAFVPSINDKEWKLAVEGSLNTPYTLSYEELMKLPAVEQIATLQCISNPVGGDLISTTKWTGVRLADVLKKAGLKPDVVEIKFTCADGYTESLPLSSAMDERTLLAYAMNGEALAAAHGFPLRLYVPNRFGMKNPKWITAIEAVAKPYDGYWEVRGWDKEAIMKMTSVIDVVAADAKQGDSIPVGGMAFSGDRGISKVELSIDGGEWQAAQLKNPLTPLTWVLWRFDWKGVTPGQHEVRVRAYEGSGKSQIETPAPLHPDGASGYHRLGTRL